MKRVQKNEATSNTSPHSPTRLAATTGLVLVWLWVLVVGVSLQPLIVEAQQPNQAGLVVDFGDHHETYCIEFDKPEISGYDMLQRAGLDVVVAGSGGMGFAVCDIEGTSGCPPSNCFCKCPGSTCVYWSYHHFVDGAWQYSQIGASLHQVQHGDVEGWGWGEGRIDQSGAQPPVIPFSQICAPPATATPLPTDTPIPPTSTPSPTTTPAPTAVPAPDAWFRLDENPIAAGSCTGLRWDTSNAQEVYLDSERVDPSGTRQVCPTAPTDYHLRVVGAEEERAFSLTLGVTGPAATQTAVERATRPPSTSDPEGADGTAVSPTPHTVTSRSPSPTPIASTPSRGGSLTTPEATPSPSPVQPASGTPSATPVQIVQFQPTATPAQVAELRTSDDDRSVEQAEGSTTDRSQDDPGGVLIPIGYVTFSLIVGGLLGWLVYSLRFRGARG